MRHPHCVFFHSSAHLHESKLHCESPIQLDIKLEALKRLRISTMAEAQPSNVKEGADQPDVLAASAEDRKAAQAMSSLDARGDEETSAPKKEADLKALGEALKSLDMSQAQSKRTESAKKEEAPKKLIKVDQADVSLLVSWIRFALYIAECWY
jgi:hypothetical protein